MRETGYYWIRWMSGDWDILFYKKDITNNFWFSIGSENPIKESDFIEIDEKQIKRE